MRKIALIALAAAVCLGIYADTSDPAGPFNREIPKDQRVQQALNRLTFGPRSGDAAAVQAMGLKKWLDLQLHPERIAENPVLEGKLKIMDTLSMNSQELVRDYPSPQVVRLMMKGQMPYPTDPDRRMMIRKLAAKVAKDERKNGQDGPSNPMVDPPTLSDLLTPEQLRTLRTGAPQERIAAFQALPAAKQDDVVEAMPAAVRQALFAAAPPELRRRLEMANGPAQVVARDLTESKILRAVYSNRQLDEVMADFWFNHFNVFLDKGADRYLLTGYERDTIRPRVFGKFRDLLEATAKSPAMLFYLDNWQSAGPDAPQARGDAAKRQRNGLNENYGRELLELHTLGVDGGYTQKDVTEVARCFTGWTIDQPQRGGKFTFNPRLHDDGEKTVLGVRIPAGGGMRDGETVLDIVAHRPSTAHFISRKLAMRFVADDPPESLVARMAKTFTRTDGDIRAVLECMLDSREFWSEGAYRTKVKSPLEMVASAVRAVNGDVDFAAPLVNQLTQLGQPLYRKVEPTGYSNSGREWLNSAGLVARMNFALQLAGNKVPGVKVASANPDAALAGIPLGSPEFQKH